MKLHNTGGGFAAAAAGLIGLTFCAAIMAAPGAPDAPPQPPLTAGDYTLTGPYTHDNLTLWLIHGPDKLKGRNFLTLQEALDKKIVVLHETGDVNELSIENVSADREVYVQSGDIVKGGKQDRTISMDFIVPPRSGKMPVASFCVEHGRWRGRGDEPTTEFGSSAYSLANKDVKLAAKYASAATAAPSANDALNANEPAAQQSSGRINARPATQPTTRPATQRTYGYGQHAVWEAVAAEQRKLSTNVGQSVQSGASASSYQLSLENPKVKEQADAYVKALSPAIDGQRDVIGYAFAINGKLNSADVYASADLFARLWPKLLRASATEALAEMKKDAKFDPARAKDVQACITDAEKARPSARPVTARVEMVTRESKDHLLFETRDKQAKEGDENWVHRNYVAK
jgi:hypothetical protein